MYISVVIGDELISDVHLWTLSHGRAKAGRPTRTYIQQLRADRGCSPEEQPEAMDDRKGWRGRVKAIHADGATWWYIYIYIYIILEFVKFLDYEFSETYIYIYIYIYIRHQHLPGDQEIVKLQPNFIFYFSIILLLCYVFTQPLRSG